MTGQATDRDTALMPLPSARLMLFARFLRSHEFLVTSDQIISFLSAVEALGPRRLDDIKSAARVVFGPAPERREEFEQLFQSFFLGQVLAAPSDADPDEEMDIVEDRSGNFDPPDIEDVEEGGTTATEAESSNTRILSLSDDDHLRRFARQAPGKLPKKFSRRLTPESKGRRLNLRRTMQQAVHYDGELMRLCHQQRKQRQRPILLLIDVSGSMKDWTDRYFPLCPHAGSAGSTGGGFHPWHPSDPCHPYAEAEKPRPGAGTHQCAGI